MDIARLLYEDEIHTIEEIQKGWSSDEKYYIQLHDGEEYLLRMSVIEDFTKKAIEFDTIKNLYEIGLPVSIPQDLKGVDEKVYALYKWVSGQDATDGVKELSEAKQYQLGYLAGQILKQIHQIPLPTESIDWEKTYHHKIERSIARYQRCGLKYTMEEKFLEVIEKYKHLIKNRPVTFQHGDYHLGNMILSKEKQLTIIDFNRWDIGDPWEEFNRIDFTATASPLFATGQLNGYFNGKPTEEFFQLLLLYMVTNTLNALPWAMKYSEKEVNTMKEKATYILNWYKDMKSLIPNWYDEEAIQRYKA